MSQLEVLLLKYLVRYYAIAFLCEIIRNMLANLDNVSSCQFFMIFYEAEEAQTT